uniref:lambda-exonuclease family protein n=1 Tax=Thiohalocapsa sp. TaxID=2497641 RepID=UPI0025EA0E74
MRIIDIEQRTPDWHIWRNLGVSASDASVILGLSTELDLADDEDTIALLHDSVSPYKTPWRLWAEKTGLVVPEDLSRNPHVQRGLALEGAAIADFEERHATLLLPLCGESEACREIRASFDGVDPDGTPVEIKVPCSRRYLEVLSLGTSSDLYRLYWPQVQTQLYVAGADKGWLVFYQGPGVHHEFVVTRDDQFIDGQLVPAMRAFWTKVQSNEAPAMD